MTRATCCNLTPVESREKKEERTTLVGPFLFLCVGRQWLCLLLLLLLNQAVWAQIGGKTATDGVFVLDDVEDVNTTAGGVGRAWIPEYVPGPPGAFRAVNLKSSSLMLYADQSTTGALRYNMVAYYGYIDYSFGVPMPGTFGASTLLSPGDLTSFTHLSFLIASSNPIADQTQEVILETYPGSGSTYPSIRWDYELVNGPAFQEVTIDLRRPTYILNQKGIPLEELLGQTRYLAFYFYGGPLPANTTYNVHVDDIRLKGYSNISHWSLY